MDRLIIYRGRWARARRGQREPNGMLFGGRGYCCLGFYCRQLLGVSDETMRGRSLPSWMGLDDPVEDVEDEAAAVNDRTEGRFLDLTDDEQERHIAELFDGIGVEVLFED